MARSPAGAAEYGGQHAVPALHVVHLRDRADLRDLRPAGRKGIRLSGIQACLGYVEPVLGIQMREQRGTDVVRLECGLDDPEPRKRMLPLARQPSNGVGNLDGAFGAINFASYDVAVHVKFFRACGLNLAPDAATRGSLSISPKKSTGVQTFVPKPDNHWGKVI